MRLLLDTHAFLWWILDAPELSDRARELMSDGANDLLLSAASSWEIAIKHALGRVTLPGADADLGAVLADQLGRQGIRALPIEHAHAWRVAELPPIHRDPFDRLLVAQAQVEGLTLLTRDPEIRRYEVETQWF